MDYTSPIDEEQLVAEVASSTFCFMNKIKGPAVQVLWDTLARFIVEALKQQKGVLLPSLGTFRVGPVVGETRKKIRPAFALLETRYSGVSQERTKYNVGGRCAIVQPNYGLLATAAAVHRGACQRLVAELLQRLGVHILSGRPLKVGFAGLGRLLTNKAGRIEFVFEPLLMEYFELERQSIIPEMAADMPDVDAEGGAGDQGMGSASKALQQMRLNTPSGARSRPQSAASTTPASAASRVQRHAHAPYKDGLLDLWRLCKTHDKINSGCVPRLSLEQWLSKECSSLLAQVDAGTVLRLLAINTYGKTGRHILYKPFVDSLEAAFGNATAPELSPRQAIEAQLHPVAASAGAATPLQHQQGREQDVVEVTFGQMGAGPSPAGGGAASPYPPSVPGLPSPSASAVSGLSPAGAAANASSAEPSSLLHYYQHELSTRSRTEYDQFNRVHFDKLEQARGKDYKRAVTPKVGEEFLNVQGHHAMRATGDRLPTPALVLGRTEQQQQQAAYSGYATPMSPGSKRTAGPPPQILTLSHYDNNWVSPSGGGAAPWRPSSSVAPSSGGGPLSQYDIANEPDLAARQRKRSELAAMVREEWGGQIREKERASAEVSAAGAAWPYAPVHTPNDKRVADAIVRSRPSSAALKRSQAYV